VAGDKKGPADFNPPSNGWQSAFALRESGVAMVTDGESDHSKSNIQPHLRCRMQMAALDIYGVLNNYSHCE
jgi:hypothetical protein